MTHLPYAGHKLRWMAIFCGIAIFLWSSPEDNHVLPVVLLGLFSACTISAFVMMRIFGGKSHDPAQTIMLSAIFGGSSGILSGIVTPMLMLLKNSRHSHLTPDFLPEQMAAILELIPGWGIAGFLFGLAVGLLWIFYLEVRHVQKLEQKHDANV